MDLELEGKVAMVTGGGAGIGAAVALAFAEEGCDVAIVDRSADPSEAVRAVEALGRRAIVVHADVRDGAAAERAVSTAMRELGRLDILVCSAGITSDATVCKMTDEQWDDVLDVNLKGAFHFVRAAARLFRERKHGKIVNIASINGLRGKFGQANYAASKGGMVAMSKSVAREMGKYNVNVNVVAPGMVRTPMSESLPAERIDAAVKETVLGRLATPRECAEVVVFLCSERARHVTGAVVHVDGGQDI